MVINSIDYKGNLHRSNGFTAGACRRPAQGSVHCLHIRTGWAEMEQKVSAK